MCQRRWLELIKNYDWEILYHSGKANMVANALSRKERLKMIMSLGELIRDFEEMETKVKITGARTEKLFEISMQPELLEKIRLCQEKVMNEGRESMTGEEIYTEKDDKGIMRMRVIHHELKLMVEGIRDTYILSPGVPDEGFKDNLRGLTRRKGMDSVWLAIKISRKTNDYRRAQDARTSSGPKDQGYNRSNQKMDDNNPRMDKRGWMRFQKKGKLTYELLDPLRKYNSDARQIGAYERIGRQPGVTYMEQPERVIDRKGTSS
ncbi:hypothetical protein AgCh_005208 [Apium graveolens]